MLVCWPQSNPLSRLNLVTTHEIAKLRVFEQVADGSKKNVFRGQYRQKAVVVLKLQQNLQLKNREAKMFMRLGYHPNFLQFYGRTCLNENDQPIVGVSNSLVTEFAPLGNLS